jgi:hypothetical protein
MKINIITVLKSGPTWLPEYVVKLKKAVDTYLTIDHEFYCISDIDIPGVNTIPMIPLVPAEAWGVWAKPQLFRKDLALTKNCLYIDLDTIIRGSLDKFVLECSQHKFLMTACPWKGPISCSALMWWNGDYSQLWEKFLTKTIAEWHTQYQSTEKYVDQGFISDYVEHELFQNVLSRPDYIGRIAKQETNLNDPQSFLFCSGKRKPWDSLHHPDVKMYWDL